jgi:hypothetical protein
MSSQEEIIQKLHNKSKNVKISNFKKAVSIVEAIVIILIVTM